MKKSTIVFYTLAVLLLIYHLLTLSISPIIWTDEVTLTSVADDFIHHGTFYPVIDLGWVNGMQSLAYGPLYFLLDGSIIKVLGNNVFAARLLGLLAGFILLVIIGNYLQKENKLIFLILLACIFTDVFFISSMHRSRNDTLSILFYYSSLFALLGNPLAGKKEDLTIRKSILSGVLFALSILTTVRTGFLVAPFAIVFLIHWWQSKFSLSFIKIPLAWGAVIIALYLPWVFWGFGGFNGFFEYYNYLSAHFPYFVGSWFRIPKEVLPVFALFFVSAIAGMFIPAVRKSIWYIVIISVVVSYFIFVGDTGSPEHTHKSTALPFLMLSISDSGPYCIIIIPAFYILISLCALHISYFKKAVQVCFSLAVVFLLLYNVGIFSIKSIVLAAQASSRNTHRVDEFIQANIPAGYKTRVCGDEVYYYAVYNNGNPFHLSISYQSDVVKTETYARDSFMYDYLVISKRLEKRNPKLVQQYMDNAQFEKVAEYTSPKSELGSAITKKLHIIEENYDGTIYKRIKN